jgi:hypothetical protein
VRLVGSRKKKLIVALHFQFSNQSGWECATCRKAGLEMKRRCGWIPRALETPERIIWARSKASTTICPKSFIAAQSLAWIEEYLVRRKLGQKGTGDQEARKVDAFLILEQELAEINGASHAGRQTNGASRRGKDA